jgi:hypothetical protein
LRIVDCGLKFGKSEIRRLGTRRGVLMLVVLSLLVLFMLIGTAFLMSSNQYGRASKASAKLNRVGNYPTKLLDRAVMQIIRDTANPNSAIRSHSLLGDLYGTDGFQGVVYSPLDADFDPTEDLTDTTFVGRNTRFAGATPGTPADQLGPTQGQMVDLYVRALAYNAAAATNRSADDPLTPAPANERTQLISPDARHVLKLDRDANGQTQLHVVPQLGLDTNGKVFLHVLPLTRGYYNGCLLTVTSGPAAGQSTRILDYEYISDIAPTASPGGGNADVPSRLYRFRVMAFPRADGLPLQINQLAARSPEIADLAGATFIVNGRPLNGTGGGYNPFSVAGDPRLTARESIKLGTAPTISPMAPPGGVAQRLALLAVQYPEIALTPNAAFFFPFDPTTGPDNYGARYEVQTTNPPNSANGDVTFTYPPLNPKATPIVDRAALWRYQSFVGPGGADESYDAADFQNMFLALQTLTPRTEGRVVHSTTTSGPVILEVNRDSDGDGTPDVYEAAGNFLRLDLEDLPLPSFHRPDLVNFWYHRLIYYAANPQGAISTPVISDDHVRAVLEPYGADGIRDAPGISFDDPTAVAANVRDQIVALKRKISLRPIREDHPNFDGSNPQSRPVNLSSVNNLVINGHITVPYWEAVGPWDVDNDNDGVPDSVWVDLGEPVAQAEDGTLYKPLFAFLIIDLDSRLNVNAHGLVDHLIRDTTQPTEPPNLDLTPFDVTTLKRVGNLANDLSPTANDLSSSNSLAHGLGYGPAEISLRPVLSPLLPSLLPAYAGDPGVAVAFNADDYARLLVGRPAGPLNNPIWGRHGLVDVYGAPLNIFNVRPGMTYDIAAAAATSDILASLQFFGHPGWLSYYYDPNPFDGVPVLPVPTKFGSPPDLFGRYAVGLDYVGQPVYEAHGDALLYGDRSMLVDAPYELDLSSSVRRDVPAGSAIAELITEANDPNLVADDNDDAPFATADLERILRSHDADAGILPDRLWNIVDAFDPVKLVQNQPVAVEKVANDLFDPISRTILATDPSDAPQMLAAAQSMAGPARRLVTTDSYGLPVPGGSFLSRLIYGADGQPGQAGFDDDDNGIVDDPSELGWGGSDDYEPVMKGIALMPGAPDPAAAPVAPRLAPDHPTIVDLLKYRVQYERLKRGLAIYDDSKLRPELSAIVQQMLAPEVIAGGRMDLNRPFGDGRDSGDGIDNDGVNGVDDSGEMNYPIGDPRRDPYMNGIVDDPLEAGDPFVDANGNGRRDPGEYFYNVVGVGATGQYTNVDADYDGPIDLLWAGLTGEPISFDYNHGGAVEFLQGSRFYEGRRIDLNDNGIHDVGDGRLRDNGVLQRQVFARHLYCLMMLLVDDNYLATQNVFDDEDGNINLLILADELSREMAIKELVEEGTATPSVTQINARAAAIADPNGPQLHIQWALRKMTARRIAQWAINCVDFRDPDAIMTPFEYDEYPFDGWGVYARDPNDPNGPGIFVPLDGDPATNENWGQELHPIVNPDDNSVKIKVPIKDNPPYSNDDSAPARENGTREFATREVVWGVERPELLITETLAFHDRRCTDDGTISPGIDDTPIPGTPPDYDLDQRLKPRGSLFVELYNPWSPDGQRPAEFYDRVGDIDPTAGGVQFSDPGVMLNKLSDFGIPAVDPVTNQAFTKRSPVWRMAVVREPIPSLLTNQIFDVETAASAYTAKLLTVDPDGFGFNSDRDSERLVYFSTGDDYRTQKNAVNDGSDESDPNRSNDDNINAAGATVGEYDFSPVPPAPPTPMVNQLRVWVPPIAYRVDPGTGDRAPAAKRYFIARTDRENDTGPNDSDCPIAPILPGRYAVVGPSGLQLTGIGASGPNTPGTPDNSATTRFNSGAATRFVTPTSRMPDQPDDANHRNELLKTRRIELWPTLNPNLPQMLIGANGGPEIVRVDIDGDGVLDLVNVTDARNIANGTRTPDGIPDSLVVEPCVAIPVEDLNISEPVEGYPSDEYIRLSGEMSSTGTPESKRDARLNSDGELAYDPPFDHPLDLEIELVRNGTTPNYRSIHLQRLANPALPWNPPPLDEKGNENKSYQPHLPVNPYQTVDSQSVDLTAFNGASERESELPTSSASNDTTLSADLPGNDVTQRPLYAPLSPDDYRYAPDHVLWGVIRTLVAELNIPTFTPTEFREMLQSAAGYAEIDGYFNQLSGRPNRSSGDPRDQEARDFLRLQSRMDQHGRRWGGKWGWSLFQRVLPEDSNDQPQPAEVFVQQLHFKSLERGAHDFLPEFNGWRYDPNWTPRLLWKQEKANFKLSLRHPPDPLTGQVVEFSDLFNVPSRRLMVNGPNPDEPMPQDVRTRNTQVVSTPGFEAPDLTFNFTLQQTLGFANEVFAPELDRMNGNDENALLSLGQTLVKPGAPEVVVVAINSMKQPILPADLEEQKASPRRPSVATTTEILEHRQRLMRSTYPWLAWNNRPFVSENELTQVPATASSLMLRSYSVASNATPNPYDGNGQVSRIIFAGGLLPMLVQLDPRPPTATFPDTEEGTSDRFARQQGIFGHLLNFFQSADKRAGTYATAASALSGAPHFYRLLDYVEVPSRYVGTDDLMTAEIFHDLPPSPAFPNEPIGSDFTSLVDPRINFQPPFNKVSRDRDPGRVNLNTVVGRRTPARPDPNHPAGTTPPRIWSEVYDGLMHRYQDGNLFDAAGNVLRLGHFGPAWRDVVLSRRGYAQFDPDEVWPSDTGDLLPTPVEKVTIDTNTVAYPDEFSYPDTFAFGLNKNFPSVFSNPFRSPDAGDLVPLEQMRRQGIDASLFRGHHYARAREVEKVNFDVPGVGPADYAVRTLTWAPYKTRTTHFDQIAWGLAGVDDDGNGIVDDVTEAGYGTGPGISDDMLANQDNTFKYDDGDPLQIDELDNQAGALRSSGIPLFSESMPVPAIDAERNPAMMYQPMTRLGNLVTNRSNVFAVWVTVGYFEVEPAPNWNDPDISVRAPLRERFGASTSLTATGAATAYGKALYDRVYPEGYMLAEEVGSDIGNVKRQRAFYIIDRTEPVGFKPGDDLNVERTIRVRRRIE